MVFLESAVTNQKLTLEEGAILPPGFGNYFLALLVAVSKKYNLRLNVEYSQLTQKEKDIVMLGT
jgi:excinuclease UvrABC ATPase subunit